MTFSYEKRSPGDVLSSQDWNAAMQEITRLETAKLNRTGADTFKGPLTIADALTVNGNVGLGTAPGSGFRLDIKGNLRVTDGSITANFLVKDTRDVNDSPTAFDRAVSFDFKKRETVGVPGEGTFSGMLTIAPWADNSGDAHHQLNFNEGGIFWRQGQPDATSWDPWRRIPHEGMTSSFTLQGNVGIGLTNPGQAFVINSTHNTGRQAGSGITYGGAIAISSNAPQIDFIDTETGHRDWSIHVNSSKLFFIREPWNYQDLMLDGAGQVGIGTDAPNDTLEVRGNLRLLTHANPLRMTAGWSEFTGTSVNAAEISNDTGTYKTLMIVGNRSADSTTRRVGVWDRLEVNGRMVVTQGVIQRGGTPITGTADLGLYSHVDQNWIRFVTLNGPFRFFSDGGIGSNPIFSIDTDGSITTPAIKQPNGRFSLALQGDRNFVMYGDGRALWATNTHTSDVTLKERITTIPNALEQLLSLRGVFFFWKNGMLGNDREIGVIAQEVEQAFPELIQTFDDGQKLVKYDKFAPLLIEAIREQQHKIEALQTEVESLKAQLAI